MDKAGLFAAPPLRSSAMLAFVCNACHRVGRAARPRMQLLARTVGASRDASEDGRAMQLPSSHYLCVFSRYNTRHPGAA